MRSATVSSQSHAGGQWSEGWRAPGLEMPLQGVSRAHAHLCTGTCPHTPACAHPFKPLPTPAQYGDLRSALSGFHRKSPPCQAQHSGSLCLTRSARPWPQFHDWTQPTSSPWSPIPGWGCPETGRGYPEAVILTRSPRASAESLERGVI